MKKPRIVVIGLSGQSAFMKVDHFHNRGETLKATRIYFEPGGKGYNQAVSASRLGGEVYFISAIGNDDYGRLCEERLLREGVIPCLIKKEDTNTAFAVILTDKNGENQVTVYRGASDMLSASDIEKYESIISTAGVLLIQLETPIAVNKKAVEIADKYKILTILNPAPPYDFNFGMISENTILTPNEFETRTIFGLQSSDELSTINALIQERKKGKFIVTAGRKGCLVYDNNIVSIPAIKVKVSDTTGAGDVFNGALAVAIASGDTLIEASKFAVIASGLSVTKNYVLNSIPYRKEVLDYIKDYNI
ncbi:MAG: ribokinase [Bacilli bacterium]|nr:ribokinase [Bacilli bacterium]MDD4077937.1 ribokinase [Bacilli bacterium]MDD4388400.1 ribokinase [Bacilli bacterium]